MTDRLTTSSYAVLGLLALRPWSGYELAQQAKRSLRFVWPKSESHLYAEPKKLVALGFAAVRTEPAGRRTRQVYRITPAGRRAVRAWLATAPAPPEFEAEAMLRLLFADLGDRDEVLAALGTLAEQTRAVYEEGLTIVDGYQRGDVPFPDRLHLSVLFASFQFEYYRLILRWVEFARSEIASWPRTDGLGATPGTARILDRIAARQDIL